MQPHRMRKRTRTPPRVNLHDTPPPTIPNSSAAISASAQRAQQWDGAGRYRVWHGHKVNKRCRVRVNYFSCPNGSAWVQLWVASTRSGSRSWAWGLANLRRYPPAWLTGGNCLHYAQHRYKRLSRTKTDQSRGANAGHTVRHCLTPNNNRILTDNTTPAGCTQQHMGNTG